MIEEGALAGVERGDRGHVVGGEIEVEDVEVLGDPFLAHGLGDRDHAALREPAQDHLGAMLLPYFAPIDRSTSCWKMSFLPSANGPHDSICTPFS